MTPHRGGDSSDWTNWCVPDEGAVFSPSGFAETIDGGQLFRFVPDECGTYTGVWGTHIVRLRLSESGVLEASFPRGFARESLPALAELLGSGHAHAKDQARLAKLEDPVLSRAMSAFPGLRVVRQPLPEALLAFLCSPMKRIAHIKAELDALANAFGAELAPGVRALPGWEVLAEVEERELRACGLGFRAGYVSRSARMIAEEPDYFESVAALPYPLARKKLCELFGVGGKIADCALLYSGTSALRPFPVDTWIARAMAEGYGLGALPPEKIADFGRERFGDLAGLAQQYLFAFIRKNGTLRG